jgi:hypothetical protein
MPLGTSQNLQFCKTSETIDDLKIQSINKRLLTAGFILANILWIKALMDIAFATKVFPHFSFPGFFIPLFILGAIFSILLSMSSMRTIFPGNRFIEPVSGIKTIFIWLAIPLSVICTSPVCYSRNIFFAPYLTSTVIRQGLLCFPIIAAVIYYFYKKEAAILLLLVLCFLLLVPNDKCYNPFNYWWIDHIGASPLTYLPTMLVMLFGITGLYGNNKYLTIVIQYSLCLGALFIAVGHRIHLLW